MPDVATQTINFTTKAASSIALTIEELAKAIAILLENHQHDETRRILEDYAKNDGTFSVYKPKDFAFDDIVNKFDKSNGFDGRKMRYLSDKVNGFILVREEDRDTIRKLEMDLYQEQKRVTRILPSDFQRMQNGRPVTKFELTKSQLQQFQNTTKSNIYNKDGAFIFTAIEQDNGKYVVYVDQTKNGSKAKQAINEIALGSSGINGKHNEEKQNFNIDTIKNAYEKGISNYSEMYICSTLNPNDIIHVYSFGNGNMGFERKKLAKDELSEDQTIRTGTYENNGEKYNADLYCALSEITNPVILSPEEFKSDNKIDVMKEKYYKNISALSKDEKEAAAIQEEVKKIVKHDIETNNIPSVLYKADEKQANKLYLNHVLSNFNDDKSKQIAKNCVNDIAQQMANINDTFIESIDINNNEITKDFGQPDINSFIDKFTSTDRDARQDEKIR